MKFDIPSDFAELPTDTRQGIMNAAENAMREQQTVFFRGKHFTNFDELRSYLTEFSKAVSAEHDWNGESSEDFNG